MLFDLATFTLVHVLLSVAGILAGLVVVGGFLAGVRLDRWIAVFLVTTLPASVTGFGFPFKEVLPAHLFGVATLLALPFAFVGLYVRKLEGRWREVFVGVSVFTLYLNVFVLVAQLLAKIPVLAQLAPAPNSPVFGATQLLLLALFVGLGWACVKGFRVEKAAGGVPLGAAGASA